MPEFLFVTGKLAAHALKRTLASLSFPFEYDTAVLGCSVAALMTVPWIGERVRDIAPGFARVMIPGSCQGDVRRLEDELGVPCRKGPSDLRELPVYFGQKKTASIDQVKPRLKILAEIVDAHLLPMETILERARYYRDSGADIIDLGGPPTGRFQDIGSIVSKLKTEGFQVSLDCFDKDSAILADRAGLDMLLSVNSENLEIAPQVGAKVVLIPDAEGGLESMERNLARLRKWGVPCVLDPILNPLCLGFTESIGRYARLRQKYPEAEMLMGLGNLTELTDADSNGLNALLAGITSELAIDYALTTEVIAWAKGSVRELDLARRIMDHAVDQGIPPKRIDERLIIAKDPGFDCFTEEELRLMQSEITDKNYRLFIDTDWIYVMNKDLFIKGADPGRLFAQLEDLDAAHAFYLGRELERAAMALSLGKQYNQDQPLRWGYRTKQ